MSPIYIDIKHQIFWLSYDFLMEQNIPQDSIGNWRKRKLCVRKYIDGRAYINYDSIPEPTRVKLPSKDELKIYYRNYKNRHLMGWFTRDLNEAYRSTNVIKWMKAILSHDLYKTIERGKITECARRAAVLEVAAEIQGGAISKDVPRALYEAYCTIYPNNYNRINRFAAALRRVREEGVLSVAVDKRRFIYHAPKYGELHIYGAEYLLNLNKAYSIPDCYDLFV